MRYHPTIINNGAIPASLNINLRNRPLSSSAADQKRRMKGTRHDDDAQIARDVMNELRLETSLSAMQISVAVKDGIATLSGRADGNGELSLIETAARRIAGVKGVMMKLELRSPELGIRSDDDILSECENVLGVAMSGPNNGVKVRVNNGWVSLSGDVAWGYERWMAEAAISQLPDVTGVNSQIHVREKK
ncbi:BON domain-containing protein [Noviherbaspirillum sp. UKPF54]|uniref:BON domain-containing protein n=1 Tax=Noviherbaspirillum sp. UKPF54 TaxID=2601898 RepID=UPI0011B12CF4|nr:BON domain-containing protein [Noviherbaspirillum sp. UKPF54]QDZ30114.1 BON domain-containing protein [Noviherbaspirillum sp. UKPF54]